MFSRLIVLVIIFPLLIIKRHEKKIWSDERPP